MAKGKSPQLLLEFNAVRNSDLFSNHWLENRLPLEPEWVDMRPVMIRCVTRPDDHVMVLLNRLGIELPNHLKRCRLPLAAPAEIAQACPT